MKTVLRFSLATLVAAAALVAPSAAAAAPSSTSFTIVGYEYAFTSTAGSFAGRGLGNAGDTAAWNAYVKHDPIGSNLGVVPAKGIPRSGDVRCPAFSN